ncbi:MAG: amidohydrolase family protein [Pseudomonadota bacterium]
MEALRAVALAVLAIATMPSAAAATSSSASASPYTMADFARTKKFDSHVHMNVVPSALLEQVRADGFEVMSINVDYPDFPALDLQRDAALALVRKDPKRVHWAATFSMKAFGEPGWSARVQAELAKSAALGARAVKVWKNIGMIEKRADGSLVMLDDPAFGPVADQLEKLGLALIAHQGEPYNCWLPLDQMTTDNDREYFEAHPQYHMFLHPEQPSHADLMAARDRFVAAHPTLRFDGAHMASLEYDVEVLAAFLDKWPNASADLAARMSQVQYQSVRDREKVRAFFIKYQDRLLYGTDLTENPGEDGAEIRKSAHETWLSDWRYLATDEPQRVEMIKADVPGLALPRAVIDKIYYRNARAFFRLGK